ncbi:MAG: hypothetical protein JSR79_10865 [Proteobacteria bacterium]|nr:hypothetical protein [Pseudomonadota bacterium]
MTTPTSEILNAVAEKVGTYAGERIEGIEDRYLHRDLKLDGFDFVDLCEGLELTFKIDLRPFFEADQPEIRRFFQRRKVARDATVRELATEVERVQGHVL